MTYYSSKEKGFDRILLFKPQNNMTYIRKLSMSYGYYTPLAVVDDYDNVSYIGVENNFTILQFQDLSVKDINILGEKKCEQLNPDDSMCIYRVIKALKLDNPLRLEYYHGMRYTNPIETNMIKKSIIDTLKSKDNNGDYLMKVNRHVDDYKEADNIQFDLDNIVLDDELLNPDLPYFNSLNANGQTKLI